MLMGVLVAHLLLNSFMKHFSTVCADTNDTHLLAVKYEFLKLKGNYVGLPLTDEHLFDVELVDSIIAQLKRGKAAGLDNITAEHLQHSHHV